MAFSEGELILLRLPPYRQHSLVRRSKHKFSWHYYAPFMIIENMGKVVYCLQLPNSEKIHHVYHVSMLKQ